MGEELYKDVPLIEKPTFFLFSDNEVSSFGLDPGNASVRIELCIVRNNNVSAIHPYRFALELAQIDAFLGYPRPKL